MIEQLSAKGHPNVSSLHKTTFEITKEDYLTPQGDCIIAIMADRGLPDLSDGFKEMLRKPESRLRIELECCGIKDSINARGCPGLLLDHPTDLVVRKSTYTCSRTLGICADKAAIDLDRQLIKKLSEGFELKATLTVKIPA